MPVALPVLDAPPTKEDETKAAPTRVRVHLGAGNKPGAVVRAVDVDSGEEVLVEVPADVPREGGVVAATKVRVETAIALPPPDAMSRGTHDDDAAAATRAKSDYVLMEVCTCCEYEFQFVAVSPSLGTMDDAARTLKGYSMHISPVLLTTICPAFSDCRQATVRLDRKRVGRVAFSGKMLCGREVLLFRDREILGRLSMSICSPGMYEVYLRAEAYSFGREECFGRGAKELVLRHERTSAVVLRVRMGTAFLSPCRTLELREYDAALVPPLEAALVIAALGLLIY